MENDDLKKLMEIAARPLKKPLTNKKEKVNTVLEFIHACGVRSSDKVEIPTSVVYNRYRKYCSSYNLKHSGLKDFVHTMESKYEKVTKKSGTFFKLNPEGFDLSAAGLQEAKERWNVKKKKN